VATEVELQQVAQDALERYWRAVELADGAREAWVAARQPLTEELANGVVTEAPLLKVWRSCERDCERFARAIPMPKGEPGRPAEAVFRQLGGEPPSARLRRLIDAVPDR
jgi:hypothetical protein